MLNVQQIFINLRVATQILVVNLFWVGHLYDYFTIYSMLSPFH